MPAPDLAGATIVDRRVPVRALNLAWHRLEWPPAEVLAGRAFDVVHSPHPLLTPTRSAAQVITIHDLNFLSHPERTRAEIRRDYPVLVTAHARRADAILVPSAYTAGEVERLLGVLARTDGHLPTRRARLDPAGAGAERGLRVVLQHAGAEEERRRSAGRVRAAHRVRRTPSSTRAGRQSDRGRTALARPNRRRDPLRGGGSSCRLCRAGPTPGAVRGRAAPRAAVARRRLRHDRARSDVARRPRRRRQPRLAPGSTRRCGSAGGSRATRRHRTRDRASAGRRWPRGGVRGEGNRSRARLQLGPRRPAACTTRTRRRSNGGGHGRPAGCSHAHRHRRP